MSILIKNGNLLDPQTGELLRQDLLIENGIIVKMAESLERPAEQTIDVNGKLIVPGLIDLHVHLREPGFEAKETIESGTKAAARGGFTTVCCMPNTRPVIDAPEVIQNILNQAEKSGSARVYPLAAITVRQLGEELTDFVELKKAGAIALSDDGVGIQRADVMKRAMQQAAEVGLPIVAHCEDNSLAHGGCVHDGVFAKKYGLKGIPASAESVHIARDLLLAEETGAYYHVCHISSAQSVRLVRDAKARGLRVTSEVTPHHLLLCDEDIPHPDANWKMNPPLRSREDREALIQGLVDGTIDVIATDHAPHTPEEKAWGMEKAPFGIVGLETAFPLLYTHLVLTGVLTLAQLVEKMTSKPAQVFGLPYGVLAEGKAADLTVIDLELERVVDPAGFLSKGRNTPFAGWKVKGWPVLTMLEGKITWQDRRVRDESSLDFGRRHRI